MHQKIQADLHLQKTCIFFDFYQIFPIKCGAAPMSPKQIPPKDQALHQKDPFGLEGKGERPGDKATRTADFSQTDSASAE
ncbi:hypothetical protein GCM10027567_08220 [Spongiibacter taiwanensis]